LARELRPYVGQRAEFIAGRVAPGLAEELLSLVDQALDRLNAKEKERAT